MKVLRRVTFGQGAMYFSLALLICFALSGTAQATIIAPGPGAFPPDVFAACPGCVLQASVSSTETSTSGALTFTLNAAVYSDPGNVFGAGDLDFVYQVMNSAVSPDSVGRVTGIDFTGFSTDVGYTPTGSSLPGGMFVDGTVTPQLVDRVHGDVVGFSFNAPLSLLIGPGDTSVVLVVQTDATNFKAGHANVIDGGVSTVAAFEPAAPTGMVPEPATMGLFGAGMLALAGIRRSRRALNR
jgi:hypothetical protein